MTGRKTGSNQKRKAHCMRLPGDREEKQRVCKQVVGQVCLKLADWS